VPYVYVNYFEINLLCVESQVFLLVHEQPLCIPRTSFLGSPFQRRSCAPAKIDDFTAIKTMPQIIEIPPFFIGRCITDEEPSHKTHLRENRRSSRGLVGCRDTPGSRLGRADHVSIIGVCIHHQLQRIIMAPIGIASE